MPAETSVPLPNEDVLGNFKKLITRSATGEWPVSQVLTVLEDPAAQYTEFDIPKGKGRTRKIAAPSATLMFIQDEINDLLQRATVDEAAYGFRRKMSAYKGLRRMLNQTGEKDEGKGNLHAVFQTDIQDFFPSIKKEQARDAVYAFLWRILHRSQNGPQLPETMVQSLADLLTQLCCLRGQLPQGAPTSPALANMVAQKFDTKIRQLIGDVGSYGRYADDIVIFGTQQIPEKLRGLVCSIIESCGFTISHHKSSYEEKKKHYNVWGVDVFPANTEQGVAMRFKIPTHMEIAWAKEMFETIEKSGADALPTDPKAFMEDKRVLQILGRLSHAYNVTKEGLPNFKPRPMQVSGAEQLYTLPPHLAHAWACFQRKFGDRLPRSHPAWFTSYTLEHEKKATYDAVTRTGFQTIFDKRLDKLATRRGIVLADLRSAIDQEKQRLLTLYCEREDGVQCTKDKESYPDTDIAATVNDLCKNIDQLNATDLGTAVHTHMVTFLAFAELLYAKSKAKAKSFAGFQGHPPEQSLLPVDMATAWLKLQDTLVVKGHSSLAKGLRYMFWNQEKTVTYTANRIPREPEMTHRKTWISLPGFKQDE